jgi:hypothetical protein
MRPLALALGAFLAAAALAAYGEDGPKPDLGAGPHQGYQPMEGGNGERLRPGSPEPQFPKPAPEPAKGSTGAAKDGEALGPAGSRGRAPRHRAQGESEEASRLQGGSAVAASLR